MCSRPRRTARARELQEQISSQEKKVSANPGAVQCLRPPQIPDDGCGDGWGNDGQGAPGPLGGRTGAGGIAAEPWADWNSGPAAHLLLDDGFSAWLACTRVALGDGRGASAASLVVEAFGDAVVPDIPEAIGHAILRVERALDMVLARGPMGGVS